ncbi:MAG: xanthine dehydrogenase family protein subunit M [Acidobacteriota bacterium]|nr:xanthine dehydrogenase family protein subunit M [Acidobacteriota bacterium]
MNPFLYQRATTTQAATRAVASSGTKFLAGGTNVLDLMKYGVEHPSTLIDITRLNLNQVAALPGGGISIGAMVRNSDLADHPLVRERYPLLAQALLSGASPQLRNMATTGGNLLQRTRCYYFMDTAFSACNKRAPGTGCAALTGFSRIHAILGQTDRGPTHAETCIATNPSDMNVALAALNATIHVQSASGSRTIPIADFHRLPGTTPHLDTTLHPEELITAISLPPSPFAAHSHYLKIRDRNSYAFALVSVAAGLEIANGAFHSVALALGGVAHKPWRSAEAERFLVGAAPEPATFRNAAELALAGARGYEHNAFKIELAKQAIVRALTQASGGPA